MSDIQLNDPQTLYRRWEESQWSPFAVDLSTDRGQWPKLEPTLREIIYFALSSLMVAEERITTKFAGLVAAHAPEEETTFLATQQVDEARHMQFYARFRDEVIAEPRTIAAHVELAREQVSDSFRELFDGALVELHDELVANPGDLAVKVRFVKLCESGVRVPRVWGRAVLRRIRSESREWKGLTNYPRPRIAWQRESRSTYGSAGTNFCREAYPRESASRKLDPHPA